MIPKIFAPLSGQIRRSLPLWAIAFAIVVSTSAAETGVSDTEVRIGMVNAQTGSASALGTGLSAGASAFFSHLNAAGGVNGRKILLVSKDDGYQPEKCVSATKELVDSGNVFSLFGYVGTPTATAVMPVLAANPDLAFFAPLTGAEFLRNPVKKNVFNVRASYFDETETLVDHLTTDLGIKEIGIFIQSDAFGSAGEAGVLKALRKRGLNLSGKGTYTRNTVDVAAGLDALKQAQPKAVIMVGAYKACAAFIKAAKAAGFTPVFCNISFVGTSALVKELGGDAEGVVISQVMPSPYDPSIPVAKGYQEAMTAAGSSEFDYTSFEGYVDARIYAEALKKAGENPTRAQLLEALENLNVDIGGVSIAFSPTNHSALKQVFLTRIQDGKVASVEKL
jgi:ABC-type branched-subunit amino acid transport system substrate-binding protein